MTPPSLVGAAMRAGTLILAALTLAAVTFSLDAAWPRDVGQIPPDVPEHVRSWFKNVHRPDGVRCCDIADGHRTTWRGGKDGGYEVPIEGNWTPVPPEAIVYNAGNPVGEAIVWYVQMGANSYYIRCFVPGGGV